MNSWWMLAIGYFAGSIPFGFILAKVVAKKDVRLAGSGNIGATNVARVVGKKLGLVTLVLDTAKGAIPVVLASRLAPPAELDAVSFAGTVGLMALIGHCFPVWLLFRGGKGVATGLGVLLVHRPDIAGVGLIAFAVAFAATRLVSVGSLLAAIAVIIALVVRGPHDVTVLPVVACFLIVLFKHRSNMTRLWRRAELKV